MEPGQANSNQVENETAALRPFCKGSLITNGRYNKTRAEAVLADGLVDPVSFGVPFIINPDLVHSFRTDAALNAPDPAPSTAKGRRANPYYPTLPAGA